MTEMNCVSLRDRLPDLAAGKLDDITATSMARHLAGCAGCQAEAAVIERIRTASEVPLPAGLEARVVRAVRAQSSRVRPLGFPDVRHFAMAATVLFALVTATLLVRPDPTPTTVDPAELAGPVPTDIGWSAWTDPLVPGGAGLHALTVPELELVLKELER